MTAEVAKCVFSIDAKNAMQQLNLFGSKLDGIGNLASAAQAALGGLFSGGLIMAARSFVDAASDAQETTSKFGVVFSSVSGKAEAAVKKLVSTYNMSTHAARTALSDTGDLLSGFGFTGAAALDLAEKINQLGSDLASFTNYEGGAKGAAEALTKALLGEREQAKMLGIAITEEQVQAQMAADKKAGLIYQSQAHAKAYATYAIAVRQSGNAIGDAERSITSYAYNVNRLKNNLDDLKRAMGTALIGPATAIAQGLATTANWFNNLNPAVVTFATRIAVVGGVLGSAAVSLVGLVGVIKTYIAMQTLASIKKTDSTAKSIAETAATGSNTASIGTNTATVTAATAAKAAQTKATIAHTQALIAESTASKASGIAGAAGTAAGTAGKAATVLTAGSTVASAASDIPYWAKGIDYSEKLPAKPEALTDYSKARYSAAEKAAKLGSGSKYRSMGETIAKNSALKKAGVTKIGTAADLLSVGAWLPGYKAVFGKIGSIFTKFGGTLGKFAGLVWKPVSLLGSLLGPSKIFGVAITRIAATFAGFAIPFVGWGTAIATGAGLLAAAVKKMPMALEYLIQEIWPKVKNGMLYVVGKVSEFLTPSNIWKFIKNGAKAFGNLLVDGAKAVAETAKRIAGYETETQKTYIGNKIAKALEDTKRRADEAAEAERKLAIQREESIKAMTVQARDMAKLFASMFSTGNEEKQAERKKAIENQQKKIDEVFGNKKEQASEIVSQKAIRQKEIDQINKELKDLETKNKNTNVGDGKLSENGRRSNELVTKLQGLNKANDEADTKLKALQIDPQAVQKEFEALLNLKAEDAKETAKENRETAETRSNNAFERSVLGKTGSAKTDVLQKRLTELEGALNADKELYAKQESARSKLKEMANNTDNAANAELAKAAVNGDKEALNKIGELYGGLFADMGAMLTDSVILDKEKAVQEAKDQLREAQANDRDILRGRNENKNTEALNKSQTVLTDAESAWNQAKTNAMTLDPNLVNDANAKYRNALTEHAINQKNAVRDRLQQIEEEIAAETDEGKLNQLRSEQIAKRQELRDIDRDLTKKVTTASNENHEVEKQRWEKRKALNENINSQMDDILLKEAKTGQQRVAVYKNQYQRAMQEYKQADTDEKRLEALGKMGDAGEKINEEIKAEAEKQKERAKNTWAPVVAPSKGLVAGSSEAFQIQNRLYVNYQTTMTKTTRNMLNVNKSMFGELVKIARKQETDLKVMAKK